MNLDPRLLTACKKDDRRAQSELYRCCFPVLMAVCLRYASNQDDAVAALNLGFLKILRSLDRWKEHVPFEAWIRRIMINTMIDEYRKQRRYEAHMTVQDFAEMPEAGPVDFNEADRRLAAADIEALLHQLPPMSRQVFNLFAIDGYSHKDIAELLEISEGTSKWHVSAARKQLRRLLAEVLHINEPSAFSES
ncbi:MAG: RNA polymerase sigma factor [Bacteroidetes bacterium]|nr:MAG: RNA polymerase sigma factor [Bacteroidota bacterium]